MRNMQWEKWPFRAAGISKKSSGSPALPSPEVEKRRDASEWRREGDAARDQKNWAAAARAYGHYLKLVPKDGPIWVQHGHMLKEAGLLGAAAESYDRALALMPADPDLHVQRAILHKVSGDFDSAMYLFKEAAALGYSDPRCIDSEIDFLSKTDNRRTFHDIISRRPAPQTKIYLSSIVGTATIEHSKDLGKYLGAAHYSYAFSMKGFLLGLQKIGLSYEIIANPEYIPDIRKRSLSTSILHLAFYPPDAPRLLRGAYNVLVMAWEFERLHRPHELTSHHAFANPAHMLRQFQEVWATSDFGAAAVRRSGVEAVHTVPSPILADILDHPRPAFPFLETIFRAASDLNEVGWVPLAVVPGMQESASREANRRRASLRKILVESLTDQDPVFFLSVFNIYDYRKQIRPLLDAFVRLAKSRPNVYLLLKVSFAHRATEDVNEFMLRHQISDPSEMAPPLVSDRIWITTDVLSRDQLNCLYDMSAFYVSTPHGEGQNLPLLETMGRGVVPVSVDHTAMRDYISAATGIIIPSSFEPFNLRLRERYGMSDINTYYVSARDAYLALDTAACISDADYTKYSRNAMDVVREKFGLAPFQDVIAQAVGRVSAHACGQDAGA
jgi:glycosyltransferase involved in cell wall biosynthesis